MSLHFACAVSGGLAVQQVSPPCLYVCNVQTDSQFSTVVIWPSIFNYQMPSFQQYNVAFCFIEIRVLP